MNKKYKKNTILLASYLLIIIIATFIIFQISESKNKQILLSQERIIQEAKAHFTNMVDTRSWNALYGGVYVLDNENIEPNPYLEENHSYTKDGKLLIKINPAWMTRQISEISNKKRNYNYKITSLNPINPKNKANSFEKEALLYFENNKENPFYYKFSEDLTKFNFMGALEVKPSCMKCHASQGYKIGDIRGGIRVTTPTTLYKEEITFLNKKTRNFLITIVTLSLLLLIIITWLINTNYKHQEKMENMNKYLEDKIQERTLELKETAQKLEILATTDSLTKVHNRYSIMKILENEVSRAKRYKSDIGIALFDIDFFKKVNDNYGHDIGDEVLKKLAKVIRNHLRNIDIIGRYGGEEFLIILPETHKEETIETSERIRKLVENTSFSPVKKVTISLGVTTLNKSDEVETLFKRLDNLLYQAKKTGRNKCCFSE